MCQIPPDFSFTKGDEVDALLLDTVESEIPGNAFEKLEQIKRTVALVEQLEQATFPPSCQQTAPRAVSKKWLEELTSFLCTVLQPSAQPPESNAPPLSISSKDNVDPLPTLPQLREAQKLDTNLNRTLKFVEKESSSLLQKRIEGTEPGYYKLNGVLMVNRPCKEQWVTSGEINISKNTLRRQICVPSSMRRAH